MPQRGRACLCMSVLDSVNVQHLFSDFVGCGFKGATDNKLEGGSKA